MTNLPKLAVCCGGMPRLICWMWRLDESGVLTPSFIILEPDYLLDISSLAECFREYGHHPANYMLARLQTPDNTRPLLLGNIANLFLDEWIHAERENRTIWRV